MTTSVGDLTASGKRYSSGAYAFYLRFAEFPDIVGPALQGFQGVIHAKQPNIELPPKMEYLLEDATPDGDTLLNLWVESTKDILTYGRTALLPDIVDGDRFAIARYEAPSITNWALMQKREGGGPSFVVLREQFDTQSENDEFLVSEVEQYRQLHMVDGQYYSTIWTKNSNTDWVAGESVRVEWFGRAFEEIPLFVINSDGDGLDGDVTIPILPLARRALSIYRLNADYRRALYMKGDPQIFLSGVKKEDAPSKVGGEMIWVFENPNAKAEYLDIDGEGIPLMRQAIEDEYKRFDAEGGKLLSSDGGSPESGEALRRRMMARQVTLRDIVTFAGLGFERMLKFVAFYMGEDPESVTFVPDTDFAEPTMTGREILELTQAKSAGAPISSKTIHGLMRRGRVTDMTYDEEIEEIEDDASVLASIPKVVEDGRLRG
jgi:hypothetical protein